MIELIVGAVGFIVVFVGGVAVGAANAPTVDKAITAIEAAEKSAQATIAKITAHKAS